MATSLHVYEKYPNYCTAGIIPNLTDESHFCLFYTPFFIILYMTENIRRQDDRRQLSES